MEDNQKIDAMLNLSMDVTGGQRRKSRELGTGYDEETRTWQVIIRYTGDFEMTWNDIYNGCTGLYNKLHR